MMFKRGLCALALSLVSGFAYSACNATGANSELGTHTAWSLNEAIISTAISGGLSCSEVATGSSGYLKIALDSVTSTGSGFVLQDNYSPPHNQLFTLTDSPNGGVLQLAEENIILNGGAVGSTFSQPGGFFPLWLHTEPGAGIASLAPGTYSATIQLRVFYSIPLNGGSFAESPGFIRPSSTSDRIWGTGETVVLSVMLNVDPSCSITSLQNVNFGEKPLIHTFTDHLTNVTVSCSDETAYSLGMDYGLNGDAANKQRFMKSTDGDLIQYDVRRTDGNHWGVAGTDRWHSSAVNEAVAGSSQRQHVGRFSILDNQATPQPGVYTDTVTVDVVIDP